MKKKHIRGIFFNMFATFSQLLLIRGAVQPLSLGIFSIQNYVQPIISLLTREQIWWEIGKCEKVGGTLAKGLLGEKVAPSQNGCQEVA